MQRQSKVRSIHPQPNSVIASDKGALILHHLDRLFVGLKLYVTAGGKKGLVVGQLGMGRSRIHLPWG